MTDSPPRCWQPLGLPVAILLALTLVAPVGAGETDYLMVFGSQRTPRNPNYSHSFATFVRVCHENGPRSGNVRFEARTVSWLPANLVIRTFALFPEPGANRGLHETLTSVLWGTANGCRCGAPSRSSRACITRP